MGLGSLPLGDWQFWVVTAPVAVIVAGVIRRLVRAGLARRPGAPPAAAPGVRTRITIGGDPVRRR